MSTGWHKSSKSSVRADQCFFDLSHQSPLRPYPILRLEFRLFKNGGSAGAAFFADYAAKKWLKTAEKQKNAHIDFCLFLRSANHEGSNRMRSLLLT
jgi:hypothetical protein